MFIKIIKIILIIIAFFLVIWAYFYSDLKSIFLTQKNNLTEEKILMFEGCFLPEERQIYDKNNIIFAKLQKPSEKKLCLTYTSQKEKQYGPHARSVDIEFSPKNSKEIIGIEFASDYEKYFRDYLTLEEVLFRLNSKYGYGSKEVKEKFLEEIEEKNKQ